MSLYPDHIIEHFLCPRNVGQTVRVDGLGTAGSIICGAVVRLTLAIDTETQIITDAKFKAAGCGYLIAAASVFTDMIQGLRLGEAVSLAPEATAEVIGIAPPEKAHCYALCNEALESAAIDYRSRRLEEWSGDDALICTCFGVSESILESTIRQLSLSSVEEVGSACNAGRGCGSCQPLIREILDSVEIECRLTESDEN